MSSSLRPRRLAPLAVSAATIAVLAAPALALEPPTREQLEQYRRDGSLAERVAAARRLGNHRIAPHLAARLGRSTASTKATPEPQPEGLPTIGTQNALALLVEFEDYSGFNDQPLIDDQLFGDGSGGIYPYESLRNFYRRSSYDLLEIAGSTLGWYTTPYPRSGVEQTDFGREALIREILQHYDALGHDFSQYDNDGDGEIDYFMVIWAGPHQGWAEFWWGYQTYFQDPTYTVDGKTLGVYSWQWESYDYPGSYDPSVVIHETGHALGLPDYYDYDSAIGPNGGVGDLDQMDGDGDHNCFSKYLLGWLSPMAFNEGPHQVLVAPGDETPQAALLMHGDPKTDPYGEYYMVQYRRRQGNDIMFPTDGLLIWHVDARTDDNGYFLFDNSYTEHKLLRLMEADGLEQIERGFPADAGDFYTPGDVFSSNTTPSSHRYDGAPTNILVDGISFDGDDMRFAADLGSGCAIFAEITASATAWLRLPTLFDCSMTTENCDGTPPHEWDFGDGDSSSETSVEHAYMAPGSYDWSFDASLGDASCPRQGSILACADDRCRRWRPAAAMNEGRAAHAAVTLADGRVLVVGGTEAPQIFDPAAGQWTDAAPKTGEFLEARGVLLSDGRVFVVGSSFDDPVNSEIYDPVSDSWEVTGQLAEDRVVHSAAVLADGRVLVAGGFYFDEITSPAYPVLEAEIFDPQTETWSPAGSIEEGMEYPGLTALPDGRALLTGNRAWQIFDPDTESWSDPGILVYERLWHAAVPLADGRVLLAAGLFANRATIFDPATERESLAGSLNSMRIAPAATMLASGRVLLTGGIDDFFEATASAELWDPESLSWSSVAPMLESRFVHGSNLLPSGEVLITGGVTSSSGPGGATESTERFSRLVAPPQRAGGRRSP